MLKQYGVIPYLTDEDGLKVVMITSANGYWIFPKGRYEAKLGKRGTAEQEALEEAGVKGKIRGDNAYRAKVVIKSGERVNLTLYALKVKVIKPEWEEDDRRKREVVSLCEAEKRITSPELLACLRKFARDFAE